MLEKINRLIKKVKQEKPLVLNITNNVTMDFIANGLLSLGASPVMSKAPEDIKDLLKIASAVVINLGTLDNAFIELCQSTCLQANQLDKPIILDPVGAGASHYRTSAALTLIHDYQISILRANASEIAALGGATTMTKGVDSLLESQHTIEHAKVLSKQFNMAVVISGKTDFIIDQEAIELCERGSELMPMVTGTGCLLSAVVAAFNAVEKNRFDAAFAATLFYGICGETAAKNIQGPATFKNQFIDHLHSTISLSSL